MRIIEKGVHLRLLIESEEERNFFRRILQKAEITFSQWETDEGGEVLEIPFGAYLLRKPIERGENEIFQDLY